LLVGGSLVLVVALLLAGYLWAGGNNGSSTSAHSSTSPTATGQPSTGHLPASASALPTDAVVVPVKESQGDSFALYQVSAQGGPAVPLAKKPITGHGPVLSPDRRTIIYLAGVGNTSTLRVMAADGTDARDLVLKPHNQCPLVAHLAWSRADPRFLAVVCSGQQGKTTIVLANVDGTIVRKLTSGQDHADDPSFSPDGKRIVYWSGGATEGTLFTVAVSGAKAASPLVNGGGADADPVWSKNDVIAFRRSAPNGASAIMAIDHATGTETTLVKAKATNEMPAWSPTGAQIAYVKTTTAGSSDPVSARLWIMDADGGNRHALDASGATLGTPTWGSR
jgi:Tol biopolymer transport system component